MCLGIPGEVQSVVEGDLRTGRVAFGGVVKEVCLVYVPEAQVGDFVVVHAGFAISRIDREEAARVFSYLEQIGAAGEIAEGEVGRSGAGEDRREGRGEHAGGGGGAEGGEGGARSGR